MTATEATLPPTSEIVDGLLAELFFTPDGRADPYPRYTQIRDRSRVHRSLLGFVVVNRYADCLFVLRDPRLGKGNGFNAINEVSAEVAEAAAYLRSRPRSLLEMDPPDHTRLRTLVSKAFTPRTVEQLRPHVIRLVDDTLDRFDTSPGAETDIVSELAVPLPVTVIGELLGIPEADRPLFTPWVRAATALLEMQVEAPALVAAAAANRQMEEYFVELLRERRAQPGEDLLSELLAVEDGGDALAEDELIETAILLFGAGFETTSNLIGNGLLALLTHPEELARLRADRSLMRTAIEELLRYDSPVQVDGRMAFEDVEIDGCRVEAGSQLVTLIGAANHDPSHFADPDRLDIARDEGPPLSFGSGIHYCLGAALARLEGQVVFDRLLDRFSRIELATDAVARRSSLTLRGLAALPVHLA